MADILVQTIPSPSDDDTLPLDVLDPLLETANGGVVWSVDMAYGYSYPKLDTPPSPPVPANGDVLKNIDESGNDSQLVLASSGPVYSGGGLDLAPVTATGGHYIRIPPSVAAAIWNNNQRFGISLYWRLPATLAEWASGAIAPVLSWGKYTDHVDLLSMGMDSVQGTLTFRRQTAVGTDARLSIAVPSAHYGKVAQMSYWRDDTGSFARLRTSAGVLNASGTVGSNNTANFAALAGRWGIDPGDANGWWTLTKGADWGNFRQYRGFAEVRAISQRSFGDVIDADWARVVERGEFS